MNHNLGSEKRAVLLFASAFLGVLLMLAPIGANASPAFIPGGRQVSVINHTPGTQFMANATAINGTVAYNFVGEGGNDTFVFAGGNGTDVTYLATGLGNNTYVINATGGGNSTFSLSTGANSTFKIVVSPFSGTQTFAITGGADSTLNETSTVPINGTALWSVNLGANSTVSLGSSFTGNQTIVNIVF